MKKREDYYYYYWAMNYFTIINIYDILLLYDNISIRQELDYNAIRLMLFVYSKKTKNIS